MQISIASVLSSTAVSDVLSKLARLDFASGQSSAGWAARGVKQNAQASPGIETDDLVHSVSEQLLCNDLFQLAARPKRIVKATFSRYRPGDRYGWHVDNAVMDGERTDVSFTLFLSDPASYDGGELMIDSASGTDSIKLPAGSLFIYPSTTLHQVAEVTRGERLALVGWVRSLVRDAAKRELLADLETARHAIFEQNGKTSEFDLLSKSCANLLRMWCED